ncbi:MAG: hypothetical protein KDD89_09215 [Anaerolineales bacterium]|nr:hypothetical protein [Anaerolineales bacterium]
MTVKQLFTLVLFVLIFATAVKPPLDPDLWWHLQAGELTLTAGIPDRDPDLSFTAGDSDWFMPAWLSGVVIYMVYALGGMWGLAFFFAAVVTLTFVLLYRASSGRPYLAGFVLIVGYLAFHPFIQARPQLFNLLFAAVVVFVVEGVKNHAFRFRWLWVLPPLMLVWANFHSGFLAGVAILVAYVVGGALQLWWPGREWRGFTWPEVGQLSGITAVASVLTLFNPHGLFLWFYPFQAFSSEAMRRVIWEWHSPDFQNMIFWPFLLLLGVTVLSMALSKRLPTWTDWFLVLGTAVAGLQAMRHIPLFVVVVVPIVARQVLSAAEGTDAYTFLAGQQPSARLSSFVYQLNLGAAVVVCFLAVLWSVSTMFAYPQTLQEAYPVAAVTYLKQAEPGLATGSARVFNEYDWGGYLIGRDVPVFVDGRVDLYGDGFMRVYDDAVRGRLGWQQTLQTYGITHALLEEESVLAGLLALSPDWQLLYRDGVAVIYGRVE